MSGRDGASGSRFRTATALLPLVLAAAGLLATGCAPEAGPGEDGGSAADTAAPASADTLAGADTVAADTAAGADSTGADAVRADTAPRATVGDTAADTAAPDSVERRWSPGGYMVYVRRGESPDSVAADHGVAPDTVLAGLPGFYARLTAEEAGALDADRRVRELARQIEERRPMDEPRGLPTVPDTADGG